MRKATLKASVAAPAPNSAATTLADQPVMRETSVSSEIVEAARSRFMRAGGSGRI